MLTSILCSRRVRVGTLPLFYGTGPYNADARPSSAPFVCPMEKRHLILISSFSSLRHILTDGHSTLPSVQQPLLLHESLFWRFFSHQVSTSEYLREDQPPSLLPYTSGFSLLAGNEIPTVSTLQIVPHKY